MRDPTSIWKQLIEYIFYGNFFYGICAVALMLETNVQLGLDIQDPAPYGMAFLATVMFYNYPYARINSKAATRRTINVSDLRTQWYRQNAQLIRKTRVIVTITLCVLVVFFLIRQWGRIVAVPTSGWILITLFPATALLYYGSNMATSRYSLRQIGWAKPFFIGFVWTGVVYVYPLLYAHFIGGQPLDLRFIHLLLFFKSLMYIAVLAILFDIKDYASDKHRRLGTLIVRLGIRRTLLGVVLPLALLGLIMFFGYAFVHDFSLSRILWTMVPFLLLLGTLFSFRKERSLLFYLVVIDGLMLAKAFFGILAVLI